MFSRRPDLCHRGGTEDTELEKFEFRNSNSEILLCELCGHEKKLKNDEIRKIGINEIKCLQLLIFAKRDFFSRPAPLW